MSEHEKVFEELLRKAAAAWVSSDAEKYANAAHAVAGALHLLERARKLRAARRRWGGVKQTLKQTLSKNQAFATTTFNDVKELRESDATICGLHDTGKTHAPASPTHNNINGLQESNPTIVERRNDDGVSWCYFTRDGYLTEEEIVTHLLSNEGLSLIERTTLGGIREGELVYANDGLGRIIRNAYGMYMHLWPNGEYPEAVSMRVIRKVREGLEKEDGYDPACDPTIIADTNA